MFGGVVDRPAGVLTLHRDVQGIPTVSDVDRGDVVGATTAEGVRDAEDPHERAARLAFTGGEGREGWVARSRRGASLEPDDAGHQRHLVGREPAQAGMLDDVGAVLMVLVGRDPCADVVDARLNGAVGEREKAVVARAAEPIGELLIAAAPALTRWLES